MSTSQERQTKIHEQIKLLETATKMRQKHTLVEKERLQRQYQNIRHQLAQFRKAEVKKMDAFEKKADNVIY